MADVDAWIESHSNTIARGYSSPVTTRARRLALIALVVLAGAGCSSDESDSAAVPGEALVEPGMLRVCTDPTRPPMQYRGRDGVLRGFEVDLFREIATELGLEAVWVDRSRSEIVDALARGDCDVIASSLAVRWEDQQVIQEIEYLGLPMSLLVRQGEQAPLAIGLCGRPIGTFARTWEARILTGFSRTCTRNGRAPIEIVFVTGGAAALEQLRTGRIDGLLDDGPTNAWYAQRQTDRFDDGGTVPNEDVHYAIGYREGARDVFVAVRSALFTLHHEGTFDELLHRWGLDDKGVEGLPLYS
jgi:ABC-type amino acid transport substrate-binding protein